MQSLSGTANTDIASLPYKNVMPTLAIEFETSVDPAGYALGVYPWPEGYQHRFRSYRKMLAIVGKSRTVRRLRPLEFHPHLYKQFADLPCDNDSFLSFVTKFGPVTVPPVVDEKAPLLFEPVGDIASKWFLLRQLCEGFQSGSEVAISAAAESFSANLTARLRPSGARSIALVLTPPTLFEAMLLQCAQAMSTGSELRACAMCGLWFDIGTGGKRRSARFCSDSCRAAFHNAKKIRPKAQAKRAKK